MVAMGSAYEVPNTLPVTAGGSPAAKTTAIKAVQQATKLPK